MQKSRNQDDFILPHICLFLKHTKYIQGGGGGVKTTAAETQAAVSCVKYA